jgi:hypothetical protein
MTAHFILKSSLEIISSGLPVTNSYKVSLEREPPLLLLTSGKQIKRQEI